MADIKEQDREKELLLEEIRELKMKLNKKRSELIKTKSRLANCREKVQNMKATISYQRSRILQLYRGDEITQ